MEEKKSRLGTGKFGTKLILVTGAELRKNFGSSTITRSTQCGVLCRLRELEVPTRLEAAANSQETFSNTVFGERTMRMGKPGHQSISSRSMRKELQDTSMVMYEWGLPISFR